jgi:hypothetical protein
MRKRIVVACLLIFCTTALGQDSKPIMVGLLNTTGEIPEVYDALSARIAGSSRYVVGSTLDTGASIEALVHCVKIGQIFVCALEVKFREKYNFQVSQGVFVSKGDAISVAEELYQRFVTTTTSKWLDDYRLQIKTSIDSYCSATPHPAECHAQ